ncbi:MAG: STAS domain-containing protein [bacterium]|nr:STAS domain-containing protein [bacterium]
MEYKTIETERRNYQIIATVIEKRIYLGITDIFREEILSLVNQGISELIINLENVAVMNSAGLGVLIMARDIMHKKDGAVKLTNLQPLMQDIFSRMRLDTLFSIFPNIDNALEN